MTPFWVKKSSYLADKCQPFSSVGVLDFIMDLQQLTIGELNQLFLQINERYLPYLLQPLETYKNDPYYLDLRDELRNIIVEFERRRQRS